MQFSTITTLFTLAAVAIAAPAEVVEARTGGGSCSNSQPYEYCCSGTVPVLSCILNILGNSCGGEAYCCDSQVSGTVAVGALNCVKL
ncbi:uncharacterized protein F4807DRAFT_465017 [Annulohypoxylon truncatum]|uniref:uncharacterized protein n=1 Tax=Annulohypoxylon truncatum TaxID=327061 RepID=UPI002007F633|nr:uncharacterized protein F4807DRAFT_465017 [Annulohypoxylon truncatum]KAI1205048.1 hypothetical protein F4807DRAFT_465017 [Annulohypoxylon truncatum]